MEYRKVHIQFEVADAGRLVDLYASRGGGGAAAMDAVVTDLASVRTPLLEFPTYISAGESEGDLVEVPYGEGFTAVGLALGLVDGDAVDPGITYKPVSRVAARLADYEEEGE